MNLRPRVAVIVVVVLWLPTIGGAGQTPETLAVTRVTVIDTITGRAIPDSTVTIRDGAIVSITPNGAAGAGAENCRGRSDPG